MTQYQLGVLYRRLGGWLDSSSSFLMDLVDQDAKPLALIRRDNSIHLLVNDFVYFCVAKSCKSLKAIILLIENELPEDAIIILRSLYENYLSMAYVIQNPASVEHFIYKRIGLSRGHLQHPITSKGKRNPRKLYNPKTGETLPFGLSISELARGTSNAIDIELYQEVYSYFCEHVHANMVASGNYRREPEMTYSYNEPENCLQARFYAALVIAVFLQELSLFPLLPKKKKNIALSLSRKACPILRRGIKILDFATMESLQSVISKRLNSFL